MKKRILASFLSLLLVLSLMPTSALAAEESSEVPTEPIVVEPVEPAKEPTEPEEPAEEPEIPLTDLTPAEPVENDSVADTVLSSDTDSWENCTACSEGQPHMIKTKEDLNKIRTHLSADGTKTTGYFKLATNIVFEPSDFEDGGAFYNDGHGFEPIGVFQKPNGTNKETFSFNNAVFDGDHHTISGLKIWNDGTYGVFTGLFGHVNNGSVIKNLTLDNCDILHNKSGNSGYATAGILAGYVHGGTTRIENCSVANSTIQNTSPSTDLTINATGAIAGRLCTGPTVAACTVKKVEISSLASAGSICGVLAAGTITDCMVENTEVIGSLIGGITGNLVSVSSIKNAYLDCTLKYVHTDVNLTANNIGGLMGRNYSKSEIENCLIFSEVDVTDIQENGAYIGGLIGFDSLHSTVKNTYWNVTLHGVPNEGCYVGAVASTRDAKNFSTYEKCAYVAHGDYGQFASSEGISQVLPLFAFPERLELVYGSNSEALKGVESDALTLTIDNADILSIDEQGIIHILNAGTANIIVEAGINNRYEFTTIPVIVTPKEIKVSMTDKTETYNEQPHTIEATATEGGTLPEDLELVYSYKESTADENTYIHVAPTHPGSYTVKVESGNPNYTLAGITTATLTISEPQQEQDVSDHVTVTAPSLVYDGKAKSLYRRL